jgi:hypothetical protein
MAARQPVGAVPYLRAGRLVLGRTGRQRGYLRAR